MPCRSAGVFGLGGSGVPEFVMFSARRRLIVSVAALLAAPLASGPALAQGLFDFLFKPQPASPNVRSYAPPQPGLSSGRPAAGAPRLSGTSRHASYCVRLCDGRYFPVQRTGAVQAGELCSSLCPASKTQVFSGSEISYATAGDGTRYSNLENAFVYREKVVDGCTCNGTDAFGLARIDVADDPTLRKGDTIVTEAGLEKVTGAPRAVARAGDGKTSDADPLMTSSIRGSVDTQERLQERSQERPRSRGVKRRAVFSIFGR
jgi:hypothetical protein